MKIGFDISQTGKNKAGCGYFADNLIKNLAMIDKNNDYLLYQTFGDHFWDENQFLTDIQQTNFQIGLRHDSLAEAYHFWNVGLQCKEKHLGKINLLHCNNFFCPRKKLPNAKIIYTLYDLSFINHPEYTTERNRLACFDGVLNASLNADYIIAISKSTKNHFLQTFPYYPEEKISVVYPASRFQENSEIQPKKFSLLSKLEPGKFWLNVGTIEPRKNYLNLLNAYAKLKKKHPEIYPLVFAGNKGWMSDDFEIQIEQLNITSDVIVLGYVDEEELLWLYQNCYCFLYPSFFEGFGLPVLEAMSVGAPVITSNISSIPEIVADSGILCDPNDFIQLAISMEQVLSNTNYRDELSFKAKLRAAEFSWPKAAEQVLSIYQKLV